MTEYVDVENIKGAFRSAVERHVSDATNTEAFREHLAAWLGMHRLEANGNAIFADPLKQYWFTQEQVDNWAKAFVNNAEARGIHMREGDIELKQRVADLLRTNEKFSDFAQEHSLTPFASEETLETIMHPKQASSTAIRETVDQPAKKRLLNWFKNEGGQIHWGKVTGATVGAVAIGGLLYWLSAKKDKTGKQKDSSLEDGKWTERIQNTSSPNVSLPR
jgi:hypothetical protein